MLRPRLLSAWAAVLALTAPAAADPPKPAEAEKAVKEQLAKLKANAGVATHVKDKAVEKAVPNHLFVAVHFRQFPVAIAPPAPLNSANLYVVDGNGKATHLADAEQLGKFLQELKVKPEGEDAMKNLARAWVRLGQEFLQDGYYTFELMDDATKVAGEGDKKTATATAVVMKGGNGKVVGTVTFAKDGSVSTYGLSGNVQPGPRPRCHATKLLDPDPLVRTIVEEDLLIMGRAARPYLDEQRAKASPELQQAIDRLWQRIERGER